VIMSFIERLTCGKPPVIYGDGFQSRDFVHVFDVVDAAMLVFKSDKVVNEIFNVGSGSATTINDLVSMIMDVLGVSMVKPIYMPARRGDVKHSCADIRKIATLLGYKPKIQLREGLFSLLQHMKPKCVGGYHE
ncbi:MAG: GDP-mannose 4,6-dehydratase, partial [Candidatus Aenigmatarchaeota archaeon]